MDTNEREVVAVVHGSQNDSVCASATVSAEAKADLAVASKDSCFTMELGGVSPGAQNTSILMTFMDLAQAASAAVSS